MLQPGTIFDSRYELVRLIGRGGFAEVWLVKDTLTGLEEALKIYAPGSGMDEDGLKIFVKELIVAHDLHHPHLLTPNMLGQYERQPYLIMQYCPHGSLNKKVGECTEEEAWKILEHVASGLAYLHEQGVVHQDIKPDNILKDAKGNYVITDFGISLRAKTTLRKSMRAQANSGTMAYMAPERFSAEPHPMSANDIWSLGAMMFELIEGDVPFGEFGGGKQKSGADIPTMHADISNNLKQVIRSLLALNPEERPTAKEIVKCAKSRSEASSAYNNQEDGGKRSGREEENASQQDVKQDTMPINSSQSNNKAKKEKSAKSLRFLRGLSIFFLIVGICFHILYGFLMGGEIDSVFSAGFLFCICLSVLLYCGIRILCSLAKNKDDVRRILKRVSYISAGAILIYMPLLFDYFKREWDEHVIDYEGLLGVSSLTLLPYLFGMIGIWRWNEMRVDVKKYNSSQGILTKENIMKRIKGLTRMKVVRISAVVVLFIACLIDGYIFGFSSVIGIEDSYEEWRLIVALFSLIIAMCGSRGIIAAKKYKEDKLVLRKKIIRLLWIVIVFSVMLTVFEFLNDNYYNAWIISPPAILPMIIGLLVLLWWSGRDEI